MRLFAPLLLSVCVALGHAATELGETRLAPCLLIQSDVGETNRDRQRHSREMAKYIQDTSKFFMQAYRLNARDFVTYAEHRHSEPENPWDVTIYVRFWRRYDDFIKDFQGRYETETIPGAYFGITRNKDEYGDPTSPWFREIHVPTEGQTKEQVLRHLYHEMGHLFMRTYMVYNVEVPSWIEEGTAELFQYRAGNGTNSEAARREREAWLVEIVSAEAGEPGTAIPWDEFTQVRNIDNLDFTHADPLRSSVQYAQAWSVAEFMIADSRRRRAYTQFLDGLKSYAEQALNELWRNGRRGRELLDAANDRIYRDQYRIFENAYGRDPRTVEGMWREWVVEAFNKKARRNPELHYYRGDWHLSRVARVARDQATRERALAKAEACFRQAIEGAPDEALGHVGMGRLALTRGDGNAARDHFATAVELGADSFEARLYGGYALIRGGTPEAAVEPLLAAVEDRPDHFDANLYLGWALVASGGDGEEAMVYLERARDLGAEQSGLASLIAGIAAHRNSDFRGARIHYRRAANSLGHNHGLGALAGPLAVITSIDNGQDEDVALELETLRRANHPLLERLQRAINTRVRMRPAFGDNGLPGIVGLTMEDPDAEAAPEPEAQPAGRGGINTPFD